MAVSLFFNLKLAFFFGLTITLAEETESILKKSRRGALDNEKNIGQSESEENPGSADGTKINDNRGRLPKKFRNFQNRRRCFLGSPFDCPVRFEDSLLDWPRPWGWGPGPLYPEYGPDLHRGWGGCGGPFGCNQFGCGGPWRMPGCSCGCGHRGWCCCGQDGGGGGGGAGDCPQFDDAAPCKPTPNKVPAPPQLQPFIGKQANFKGLVQMKQGKNINVQRGRKRQDITYGTAPDPYGVASDTYGAAPDAAEVPPVYQDPNQATYGNYGTWQVPQQPSPADQVVGGLFFWKLNGQNTPNKKQNQKQKR